MSPVANPQPLTWLLESCVAQGASDLHLVPGRPPFLRCDGELLPLEGADTQTVSAVQAVVDALLGERGRAALEPKGSADGAITGATGVRFRFNVARRQAGLSVALRRLDDAFQSLSALGLPESLYELCELPDGLVVVAGPTGAGKSTTLASLIDRINQTRACHIVTIEEPVEYVHAPARALVNQREVGPDTPDFNTALVAALRQDPDVILVGEIRDLETIRTAITAAETGHLVMTTVHAGDCVSAIERLVAVFPADEQHGVRRQLALVLRAIVAQHLVPADATAERQRVVVSEVLRATAAVSHLIASGKSAQIYSTMELGGAQGMQTLEQDLARLVHQRKVTPRAAGLLARDEKTVQERARMLYEGRRGRSG